MVNICVCEPDPMDLFICNECREHKDRDSSFRIGEKLVCGECAKKLTEGK